MNSEFENLNEDEIKCMLSELCQQIDFCNSEIAYLSSVAFKLKRHFCPEENDINPDPDNN